jgi:hypothetical protein
MGRAIPLEFDFMASLHGPNGHPLIVHAWLPYGHDPLHFWIEDCGGVLLVSMRGRKRTAWLAKVRSDGTPAPADLNGALGMLSDVRGTLLDAPDRPCPIPQFVFCSTPWLHLYATGAIHADAPPNSQTGAR